MIAPKKRSGTQPPIISRKSFCFFFQKEALAYLP
jgi:hypothetical protein